MHNNCIAYYCIVNGKPGNPSSKKLQFNQFIEDYTFGKHH